MPEIHRVASKAVKASRDNPIRRHVHAGTTASKRQPIPAYQSILQVAPYEQRRAPRHERKCAAVKPQLKRHDCQRAHDKCLHGRPPDPAQYSLTYGTPYLLHSVILCVQKQTGRPIVLSAFTSKAEIRQRGWYVRSVPAADIPASRSPHQRWKVSLRAAQGRAP